MNHSSNGPGKRGCRVLIADDNRDCVDSWAMLLGIQGCQCRIATDGQAALDLCAQFLPDVALLDIAMPRLDGYEVARRIRASGAPVTLIAISGWARESDRRRCYAAGFDYFLQKPADPDEVGRLLSERCGLETRTSAMHANAGEAQPLR